MVEFYSVLVLVVFGMLCTTIGIARILTEISLMFDEGEVVLGSIALLLLIMSGLALAELAAFVGFDPLGTLLGYF